MELKKFTFKLCNKLVIFVEDLRYARNYLPGI